MAEGNIEGSKTLNEEVNSSLDIFGLCDEARELLYISADILESTPNLMQHKVCGSLAESFAFSLDGNGDIVKSDNDVMLYNYNEVVFCSDLDVTFHPPEGTNPADVRTYYFDTSDTHVGYGKLCKVGANPATKEAEFLSHEAAIEYLIDKVPLYHLGANTIDIHGPSLHAGFPWPAARVRHDHLPFHLSGMNIPNTDLDTVLAFPVVDGWPDCAKEWFNREKKNGWPTDENIATIFQNGCHVVPVGHKNSSPECQNYEWRMSTVLAERTLVRSFNETQHRAHFTLKYIKNLLEKKPGLQEILTSYHIKTLMLWMVHDTSCDMWRRNNLIRCIKQCLERLHMWFDDGNLPHYFMPDNNLIDTLSDAQRHSIFKELSIIRENLPATLQVIKNFNADRWNMLRDTAHLNSLVFLIPILRVPENFIEQQNMQKNCQSLSDKSLRQHMSRIYKMLQQHIKGCFKHVRTIKENEERNFKETEELLLSSIDLDMASTKLKLANFYYTWGKAANAIGKSLDAAKHFDSAEKYIALALKEENMKYYVSHPTPITWTSGKPYIPQSRMMEIQTMLKQESGYKRGREWALWVVENRKFCWPVYYQPEFICTLPKELQYVLYSFGDNDKPFIHPRLFGKFLLILTAIDTCPAESTHPSEVLLELGQACEMCDYNFEKSIGYALLGQSYLMISNQWDAAKYFIWSYRLWPSTKNCAIWLLCKICLDRM